LRSARHEGDIVGLDWQFRVVLSRLSENTMRLPALLQARRAKETGACDCPEWGVYPIAPRIHLAEWSVMKTNEFALDDGESSPWVCWYGQDRVAVERVDTVSPTNN
jgi:hypothetical protein